MLSHTKEKSFRCNACSRSFARKGQLTRHSAIHANEKRFKCAKCPAEGFSSRADLSQHMYSHTGKKVFKCSICSRVFLYSSYLARHIRIHRGEKPYKCEYCLLTFSQKCNLATHRRQHTGEMPFVCSVCSRMFATKRSLLYHASTHKWREVAQCRARSHSSPNRSCMFRWTCIRHLVQCFVLSSTRNALLKEFGVIMCNCTLKQFCQWISESDCGCPHWID